MVTKIIIETTSTENIVANIFFSCILQPVLVCLLLSFVVRSSNVLELYEYKKLKILYDLFREIKLKQYQLQTKIRIILW